MNHHNKKDQVLDFPVITGYKVQEKIRNSLKIISDATTSTLGPQGSTSIIEKGSDAIIVTKDGVTIVKNLISNDRGEQVIFNLVKKGTDVVNEKAGDGTTTCVVIINSLYNAAFRQIELGYPAKQRLTRAIESISKKVISKIDELSINPTKDDLRNLAINAANDKELGDIVYEAMTSFNKNEIDDNQLITVDDSKSRETKINLKKGLSFPGGLSSPYFLTANVRELNLDSPVICLIEGSVTKDSKPFVAEYLNYLAMKNIKGVIMADSFSPEIINFLLLNMCHKIGTCVSIKYPEGLEKLDYTEDISKLTGASVFDFKNDKNVSFNDKYLGKCDKAIITQDQTTLIGFHADKNEIEKYIQLLKDKIEEYKIDPKKIPIKLDQMRKRYSMLVSGVVSIEVGAPTKESAGEKIARVHDSIASLKAGKQGILNGGGTSLLQIASWLNSVILPQLNDKYEQCACRIIAEVFESPIKKIINNAGREDMSQVIIQTIKDNLSSNSNFGYDAAEQQFCSDLRERGIIDSKNNLKELLIASFGVVTCMLLLDSIVLCADGDYRM